MITKIVLSLSLALLPPIAFASACAEQATPTNQPSKHKSTGRPAKPSETAFSLPGCPANQGTVEDQFVVQHNGQDMIAILRWVAIKNYPNGGCWQQTFFAYDEDRFTDCNPGARWTACAKD